jgi:hypothetical protein
LLCAALRFPGSKGDIFSSVSRSGPRGLSQLPSTAARGHGSQPSPNLRLACIIGTRRRSDPVHVVAICIRYFRSALLPSLQLENSLCGRNFESYMNRLRGKDGRTEYVTACRLRVCTRPAGLGQQKGRMQGRWGGRCKAHVTASLSAGSQRAKAQEPPNAMLTAKPPDGRHCRHCDLKARERRCTPSGSLQIRREFEASG